MVIKRPIDRDVAGGLIAWILLGSRARRAPGNAARIVAEVVRGFVGYPTGVALARSSVRRPRGGADGTRLT
jgi:hypothetical protein